VNEWLALADSTRAWVEEKAIRRIRYSGCRLALLFGAATGTFAVQIPVANGQLPDASPIEEIIVTARRREESLNQVPVSVSVFPSGMIDELNLNRIDDVARFTPGFSFSSATGRQPSSDRPSIRGITTIRNGIANSNVAATFIDGIYVGGSTQSAELYNLDRIEIMRGPQAAQFGRGTFAGAINYVTRRPSDEFEGEISVAAAEHDTTALTGWLSGPIVNEQLAFYLAAGHRQYGGEYVNSRDGTTIGGEQSGDITAKLYWSPTETLDITAKVGLQQTQDDHFPIYLQPRTLNNCCSRSEAAPRAREYYIGEAQLPEEINLATDLLNSAGHAGTELDRRSAALDIRWTLANGATLSSLTGIIDDDISRGFDSSYAGYDPLAFLPGSFTQLDQIAQKDVSQEFRYSVLTDSAVRWSAGAYYYEGSFDDIDDSRVFVDSSDAIVVAPNFAALSFDQIRNQAFFGSAEWDVSERWTAGAELRWARDRINVTTHANDDTRQQLDSFSETFTSVSPRFTLTYQADTERNYYVNIAKGTNPGDFNSNVPVLPDGSSDESFRAVDEEQLWSYEIGAKGSWWQHRATGNIAGYYLDVEDQQLTQLVELADGSTASILANVGRTAVYGLESQLALTLSINFSLSANYAYTHAEIRERISSDEADLRGSDGSVEETRLLGNVAGKRVPRVPEHMASLVLRYERPLARLGSWFISGDYTYESSRFAQEHNLIETGDQSFVGLHLGVEMGHWEAALRVSNLFDDETPVDIIRYFDRRFGTLPSFPQQGPSRASSSPRGFAVALPRGRQIRTTFRYRF